MASTSPELRRKETNLTTISGVNDSPITKDFLSTQLSSLKGYFDGYLNNLKEDIIKSLQEENTKLKSKINSLREIVDEKIHLNTDMEKDIVDIEQ